MVYCDLKEKQEKSAVYLFGVSTDNITGEVEFYSDMKKPTILKQPSKTTVPVSFLTNIVVKYKQKFLNGDFPEKVSFER